ncbi:MAG TPA: tetratricopeptide repeat protein [Opitutaceae bacterium]|nr:tetratricopeptide repeat protein [Opitutaceae bacterium]
MPSLRSHAFWLGVLLACAAAIAYLPALRGGFVWDDDTTLTRNPLIQGTDGLRRIWFTTEPTDYWPVTYSALWAEWRLWGSAPFGYHAVNLCLHLGASLLLWRLLRRLWGSGWAAWLAAALFALHPVNVESVAWITQQKSLLAMVFYLLTVGCFLRTGLAAPSAAPGGSLRAGWYGLSLAAFVVALLSKGSVATAPVVLMGLILWHRPLTWRDLAWTAPFFAVSAVMVMTNLWFRGHGSSEVIRNVGGLDRLLGAGGVVWFYLGKALWPVRLIFVYPRWQIRAGDPACWVGLAAAVGLTIFLWRMARLRCWGAVPAASGPAAKSWARPVLFAWGYFCVMLIPVMGFADVYFMKYSLVADHYQHLALIGVAALAAAGWQGLSSRLAPATVRVLPIAVLTGLGILTWRQCLIYRNVASLYLATIARNPASTLAHNNMGGVLMGQNRFSEAETQYEEVLQIDPGSEIAHFNLAEALLREGRLQEAVAQYETAIRLKPDYLEARNDLGGALAHLGRWPEAIVQFEAALRLMPGNARIHFNLANALADSGRFSAAVAEYREALRLKQDYAPAHRNLGRSLRQLGRSAEAEAEFNEAARLGGSH